MFKIDFTRPYLYDDTFYLNQGNLSTNNTFRCKVVTGGEDDLTGATVVTTFIVNGKEIHKQGVVFDGNRSEIDIIFPSEALVVGVNQLNFLINRKDGSVAQSPILKYNVWQGLTTDSSIEADSKYPLIIDLINSVNKSLNEANTAIGAMNNALNSIGNSTINADKAAEKAILAANNADSKVDEKIGDVNRALAAGTVDLELKEARKDASGFVHDTVKQRLDSDLIIGDKSLKDFVIDMNGMKESQDIAYETDTGYKVCQNTQNGVVKDFKVFGNTLINAWSVSNWMKVETRIEATDKTGTSVAQIMQKDNIFNAGDIVTVIADIAVDNPTYCYWQVNYTNTDGIEKSLKNVTFQSGINRFIAQLPPDYSHMRCIFVGVTAGNTRTFKNNGCMCIKGDLKGFKPSYFEGMASVGNGKEIGVSSVKWSGNLFNNEVLKPFIKTENDLEYTLDYGKIWYDKAKLVELPFKENTSYKFICTQKCSDATTKPRFYLHYTDGTEDQVTVGNVEWATVTAISRPNKTLEYISATYGTSGGTWTIKKNSICLYEDTSKDKYEPYLEDKKPILIKSSDGTWKPITYLNGIDKNNCDTVDSLLNKYTKKYIKYRFTGNETIDYITDYGDVSRFNVINLPVYSKGQSKILCNRFNVGGIGTQNLECVNSHHDIKNIAIFQIKTNKLETKDREGFKKWLIANPTEIIIELETPLEYELNLIYPDSFEGDTMVMVNGGPLPINVSFKITSSLPNFVKALSDQIKQLQEQVYKTNVANFAVALNTLDTKLRLDRLEAPQQ